MEIFDLFPAASRSPWAAVALAAALVAASLLLAGRLSALVAALVERSGVFGRLVERLKLQEPAVLIGLFSGALRMLFIFSAIAAAARLLGAHPAIASFLALSLEALGRFLVLPTVELLINSTLVVLESVLLLQLSKWLKRVFEKVEGVVLREEDVHLKGFSIQKVQLFSASQLTAFLLVLSRYVRYGLNALLVFIYLTGLFSIFPRTRGTVQSALGSFFQSIEHAWSGLVGYLPSLFILALVVVSTRYGIRLIRFLFKEVEKGSIAFVGFKPEWAMPTYQLVRFLVIALALVLAFPYLPGSSSPAFQGISVFIGLLFSLGSTSVVANVVSGVVLTYTGAFKVGDRVRIADTAGDVIEKGLLVTRIRTIKNEEITVPNSMVIGSHIINYSGEVHAGGLILHATITLGYDVPWRKVHATLVRAAAQTEGLLVEPKPFVLQTALDDFYVHYEVNAATDQPHAMAATYSCLYQNIQDCCAEDGIEILSPHYGALRDGNRSTMPPEHLPPGYRAPGFRMERPEAREPFPATTKP